MAWADVPAKLALWSGKEYYMTDGIARLIADYGGFASEPAGIPLDLFAESVPYNQRDQFETRLDYYLAADDNLAASVAWSPEMLRRV